jgi:hypothetical protein
LAPAWYNPQLRRHPAVPYVLPFVVFIGLLALQQILPVPVWLRFAVSMAAIFAVSLPQLRGGPSKPLLSILIGVAVFVIWIAPDRLSAAWHHLPLFDNGITGHPAGNTPPASKDDPVFLFFRIAVSALAVPVLEELFWRGSLIPATFKRSGWVHMRQRLSGSRHFSSPPSTAPSGMLALPRALSTTGG